MPHRRMLASAAAISMFATSFVVPAVAQDETTAPSESTAPAAAPAEPLATPNPVPLEAPSGDGTAVRLTTELGDVVIGLFNESAPVAAENFLNLASSGFYDDVGFHRVVNDFVVQGGDPEGTGGGGPPYRIKDELVVGTYGRGVVAMARTDAPNSQGSQFFFVLDDDASGALDAAGTYVIFGRVLEGMDVVDAIVEQGPESNLIEDPVRITSASFEQVELPTEPASPASRLAVNALAAGLPLAVGSLDTSARTVYSSEQIARQVGPAALEELEAIAAEAGLDLSQLSIAVSGAQAGDAFVSIIGGYIPGLPAVQIQDSMLQLLQGPTEGSEITEETIAGREATVIRSPSDSTTYVVSDGEIVWLVVADEATAAEAIAALP